MNFDVTAGAQPSSIITIFWFHGEVAAPHSGIAPLATDSHPAFHMRVTPFSTGVVALVVATIGTACVWLGLSVPASASTLALTLAAYYVAWRAHTGFPATLGGTKVTGARFKLEAMVSLWLGCIPRAHRAIVPLEQADAVVLHEPACQPLRRVAAMVPGRAGDQVGLRAGCGWVVFGPMLTSARVARYDEEDNAGIVGLFLFGFSVPRLHDRVACSMIGNSRHAMHYLAGTMAPTLGLAENASARAFLARTPATRTWEKRLSSYGHAIQRYGYSLILHPSTDPRCAISMWGGYEEKTVPWLQRALISHGFPFFRTGMQKGLSLRSATRVRRNAGGSLRGTPCSCERVCRWLLRKRRYSSCWTMWTLCCPAPMPSLSLPATISRSSMQHSAR